MIHGHEEVMNHLLSWVAKTHKTKRFKLLPAKKQQHIYATAKVILFQHETGLDNINTHCQVNKKG